MLLGVMGRYSNGPSNTSAMRSLHPIGEDEVIATFLQAELDSSRFGPPLRARLARDGRLEDVLRRPRLAEAEENTYRRRLLDEHRGFERREGLFQGFPRGVEWSRAMLTPDEVLNIRYIAWDWWLRLSGGSRSPRDAARRIREGKIVGVTPEEHEPIAAARRSGAAPPELIVATTL